MPGGLPHVARSFPRHLLVCPIVLIISINVFLVYNTSPPSMGLGFMASASFPSTVRTGLLLADWVLCGPGVWSDSSSLEPVEACLVSYLVPSVPRGGCMGHLISCTEVSRQSWEFFQVGLVLGGQRQCVTLEFLLLSC